MLEMANDTLGHNGLDTTIMNLHCKHNASYGKPITSPAWIHLLVPLNLANELVFFISFPSFFVTMSSAAATFRWLLWTQSGDDLSQKTAQFFV